MWRWYWESPFLMLVLLSLNVIKIKVEELEIGSNGIDWTLTQGDRSSKMRMEDSLWRSRVGESSGMLRGLSEGSGERWPGQVCRGRKEGWGRWRTCRGKQRPAEEIPRQPWRRMSGKTFLTESRRGQLGQMLYHSHEKTCSTTKLTSSKKSIRKERELRQ